MVKTLYSILHRSLDLTNRKDINLFNIFNYNFYCWPNMFYLNDDFYNIKLDNFKTITLKDGYYEVGKDIKPGHYEIKSKDNKGYIAIKGKSNYRSLNEEFGNKYGTKINLQYLL